MDSSQKILGRHELRERLAGHRARGEKIVLTNGCFDMLHAGHVRYLQAARAALVAGLAAVNYVVIFDEPNVEGLLRDLRPDVHAKGTDYTVETVPERETAAELGVRVAIVGDPKNH